MISCSKCKKANKPPAEGGCIKTGGIVDIGCEFGEPRVLTHYDEIRAMSVEELAEYLVKQYENGVFVTQGYMMHRKEREYYVRRKIDWLRQEATDG